MLFVLIGNLLVDYLETINMKNLITCFILCLIVTSCAVLPEDYQACEVICKDNGGVSEIHGEVFRQDSAECYCKNGVSAELTTELIAIKLNKKKPNE